MRQENDAMGKGNVATTIVRLATYLVLATNSGAAATFVYVDNDSAAAMSNSVSAYAVSSTGALTPIPGSPFLTGGTGYGGGGFAIHRMVIVKDKLYVSNGGSHDISAFSIDPNSGELALVAGSPFAAAGPLPGPQALAATPDHQFLYAAGNQTAKIDGYAIDANGSLHEIPGFPIGLSSQPSDVTVTPVDGKYLAVTLSALSTLHKVAVFAINPGTGMLSPVANSPFDAPPEPAGVDCNCAENRLFVGKANASDTEVNVFSMDPTGSLAAIAGSPFTASQGVNSNGVLLGVDDRKLFVSNQFSHSVDVFTVDSQGDLALVAGSPFDDGTGLPAGMATDAAGEWLFTANRLNPGMAPNSIGAYGIGPGGALTAAPGSPFTAGLPANSVVLSLAVFPPKTCCPAPVVGQMSASPGTLWPPDHMLVPVTIDYPVTEPCANTCELTVASSEAASDKQSPDWEVVDAHHVMLRAERNGDGPGRLYTITVTCTNNTNGLASARQVTVLVPHDQGQQP